MQVGSSHRLRGSLWDSSKNENSASSSILPELLRRPLSLIEFYGRIDGKEQDPFELRLALIGAIDRFEADQASSATAARGEESASTDRDGLPRRKQPAAETIDTTQLDRRAI